MTRAEPADSRPVLADLRRRPRTRVLVVGGGINGIAIFRELARQGVDSVLIERGDFAAGASAASSHMIHGGLRYLENGEFRLVREGVQERNRLLRIAPHAVTPLPTTIPIRRTFAGLLAAPLRFLLHRPGRQRERGALLVKLGLSIYDLFSRDGGTLPRHRFAGRRRSLEQLPQLDPTIRYTATYFDAVMRHPERFALDVLLDGLAAATSGRVANYVEAVGMTSSGVRVRDTVTGEELTIGCDIVVNASGPWTDLTNEAFGMPTELMGGTKGSHIVVDHPELLAATGGREIFCEYADGRIVLILPIADRVLVGTTDVDADPRERPICTEDEVDYFLDVIRRVFPTIRVAQEQIVARYAGIRPLPRHGDLAPGYVSRDYRVEVQKGAGGRSVLSLVGGKWTTFLALGQTVAAQVLALLGETGRPLDRDAPIGGGAQYPRDVAERRDWFARHLGAVPVERAEVLFDRYGTRAAEVARFVAAGDDTDLAGGLLSRRELAYQVGHEFVTRLDDVVRRRTDLAFSGLADAAVVTALGEALGEVCGWDRERRDAEIDLCLRVIGTVTPCASPSAG